MANVKITELTSSTGFTPDDIIPIVDTTATGTRKVTKNILLRALAGDVMADDSYDGDSIAGINAGETIGQWIPVFLSTAGTWMISDPTTTGKWPARGLSASTGSDGNPLVVVTGGLVRNDGWAFGGGSAPACRNQSLYLSTVAGGLSTAAPSASGACIQVLGWCVSDDEARHTILVSRYSSLEKKIDTFCSLNTVEHEKLDKKLINHDHDEKTGKPRFYT